MNAFKGGIKDIMKKTKVVNMFKSFATPDEAAVAIQSRVRGRKAKAEVSEKIAANRRREALKQRTAAYVVDKDLNRRLFALRGDLRAMLGGAQPPVLPFQSASPKM